MDRAVGKKAGGYLELERRRSDGRWNRFLCRTQRIPSAALFPPSAVATDDQEHGTDHRLIPAADLGGVDMAAVTAMTIGVGGQGNASGATGLLLIDDITVGFAPTGMIAHYALDGKTEDSSGHGIDGVLAGDPNLPASHVNGPAGFGQGLLFDGACGHQYVDLGTFNPSAATGQLTVATVYTNGEQTGQDTSWSFGYDTEASVQIGACDPGGGNPFNGAIDDVWIYDTALSQDEIRALAGM